jgi:hypothetical protein
MVKLTSAWRLHLFLGAIALGLYCWGQLSLSPDHALNELGGAFACALLAFLLGGLGEVRSSKWHPMVLFAAYILVFKMPTDRAGVPASVGLVALGGLGVLSCWSSFLLRASSDSPGGSVSSKPSLSQLGILAPLLGGTIGGATGGLLSAYVALVRDEQISFALLCGYPAVLGLGGVLSGMMLGLARWPIGAMIVGAMIGTLVYAAVGGLSGTGHDLIHVLSDGAALAALVGPPVALSVWTRFRRGWVQEMS